MRIALAAALLGLAITAGFRVRPAGPPRRARACAGEHARGFRRRSDRVTTLEFDLAMTRDGVLVVTTTNGSIPTSPAGRRHVPDARGPRSIRSPSMRSSASMSAVSSPEPPTPSVPEQQPLDGTRIPTLAEVFDLVARARRRPCPLQHRDQDHTDLGRRRAVARRLRRGGRPRHRGARAHGARNRPVVRLAYAGRAAAHRARDRARVPHLRGAGRRHDPARQAGPLAVDSPASISTTTAARRRGWWRRRAARVVAVVPGHSSAQAIADAKAADVKVIPWTVNERDDMARVIDSGRRRHHLRLSRPPARRAGGEGRAGPAARQAAVIVRYCSLRRSPPAP